MPIFLAWLILAYFLFYSDTHMDGISAIQQAAIATMGCMSMMLPYAIIRIYQGDQAIKNQEKIIRLLNAGVPENQRQKLQRRTWYLWHKPEA